MTRDVLTQFVVTHLVMSFTVAVEPEPECSVLQFHVYTTLPCTRSWVRRIRSTSSKPDSMRSNLTLFSHLRLDLARDLFQSGLQLSVSHAFLISFLFPSAPLMSCSYYLICSLQQWPRGLRHELFSLAVTLGSWVRIPLAWMSIYVYSVYVVLGVGGGFATGRSPVQGALPTVYN
jgi:hypothetical protein